MKNSIIIDRILNRQDENGGSHWSRADGDIYHPIGHSTVDTLYVLGELGATLNRYPILVGAVNLLLEKQTLEGSFKYARSSSKLPCVTARILAAIGRIGVSIDTRLEKSYQHLLSIQCTDGGWRCNTVKMGKSLLTDASNPGTTLYVLDAFRFRKNTNKEIVQLNRGVAFLLDHWDSRKPLGPCNFGIGTRFFQIEFPFLRYNLFYYTYVLSFYEYAYKDKRFKNAYQELLEKTKNGMILLENPHRSWRMFDFAQKGKISLLATQRFKEITKNSNL
jgi:hypothetical protein